MRHPCMINLLLAIAFLTSLSVESDAQLTGSIDLEQHNSPQGESIVKSTGLGNSPKEAEKQALSEAVRQVVGALLDAKTLIENENVIEDRILTVNSGFVDGYEIISPARLNSDGVYELTIRARIRRNTIATALEKAGVRGEIAGQNLWAEATTRTMNAEDACQMLTLKLPELIQGMVTIDYADENGRSIPSSQPQKTIPQGDFVKCVWFCKLSINKSFYFKTALPVIRTCFEALAMSSQTKFSFADRSIRRDTEDSFSYQHCNGERVMFSELTFRSGSGQLCYPPMLLITSASRSNDTISGISFENPRNVVEIKNYEVRWDPISRMGDSSKCRVSVSVSTEDGDLISQGQTPLLYNPAIIGPYFGIDLVREGEWLNVVDEQIIPVIVEIPTDDLKLAKKIEVSLVPSPLNVVSRPTNARPDGYQSVGETYPNSW
jgi:hypothetical protein